MWSLPDIERLNNSEARGSSAWDGEPDEITPGRRKQISQELRHILLAACRASTMDGFLLVSVVIPAKFAKNGHSSIDETRRGSAFTNLAEGADLGPLLTYAAERLKRSK